MSKHSILTRALHVLLSLRFTLTIQVAVNFIENKFKKLTEIAAFQSSEEKNEQSSDNQKNEMDTDGVAFDEADYDPEEREILQ